MTEVTKNQFSDGKAKTSSNMATTETSATSKDSAASPSTVLEQAKTVASNVAGQAKDLITHSVGDQQEKSAGDLGNVAKALRQTSKQLDGNMASPYVGQVADQVDRAAEFLRTADVKKIVGGVESFARREPLLFLGGAFALGILSARFLKSSSHHDKSMSSSSPSQAMAGMQRSPNMQHSTDMDHSPTSPPGMPSMKSSMGTNPRSTGQR